MQNDSEITQTQNRLFTELQQFLTDIDALTAIDVLVALIMSDRRSVICDEDKPALDGTLHLLNTIARVQKETHKVKAA